MRIELLEDAEQDLVNGYRFYERQSPGLGTRFLDTVWSEIDSLRFRAQTLGMDHGFLRLYTERFPFAVYYLFEGDGIRISAVLDRRRGPRLVSGKRVRRHEEVSFRALGLSFDRLVAKTKGKGRVRGLGRTDQCGRIQASSRGPVGEPASWALRDLCSLCHGMDMADLRYRTVRLRVRPSGRRYGRVVVLCRRTGRLMSVRGPLRTLLFPRACAFGVRRCSMRL